MTQPQIADPVALVREQSGIWLGEAQELRKIAVPSLGSGPERYRQALLVTRASLDRMEEILLQTMRLRGGMQRKAAECEHAAEDRWNTLAEQASRTSGSRDYEGAKERYARFEVQCFEVNREARQWRLASDLATDLAEQIRTMHFGLKDVRGELIEHLRAFVLETNLDR